MFFNLVSILPDPRLTVIDLSSFRIHSTGFLETVHVAIWKDRFHQTELLHHLGGFEPKIAWNHNYWSVQDPKLHVFFAIVK